MCIAIQCSRVTALEALTSQLFYPPTKIGVLGSGCSVATEPTAEVSRFYNVTQVVMYLFEIILCEGTTPDLLLIYYNTIYKH